jgi:hypothetical protein
MSGTAVKAKPAQTDILTLDNVRQMQKPCWGGLQYLGCEACAGESHYLHSTAQTIKELAENARGLVGMAGGASREQLPVLLAAVRLHLEVIEKQTEWILDETIGDDEDD